jgi:hypothetical protein
MNYKVVGQDGENFGEIEAFGDTRCREIYKGVAQKIGVPEDEVVVYNGLNQLPNDETQLRDATDLEKGNEELTVVQKAGTGWGILDKLLGFKKPFKTNVVPKGEGAKVPSRFPLSYEEAVRIFDLYEGEKHPSPRRMRMLNSFAGELMKKANNFGVIPVRKTPSRFQFVSNGFKVDIVVPKGAPETRYEAFCNLNYHHHVYRDFAVCIKFEKGPFAKHRCEYSPCDSCRKICKRTLLQYLIEILDVIRNPNLEITPASSIHFKRWPMWGVQIG